MRIRALASGSAGNAYVVGAGATRVLVDCGLCYRDLVSRMTACGLAPGDLSGVFFTHDHQDHYKGLAVFAKHHPSIPLYATDDTAAALAERTGVCDGWNTFEPGASFSVGALSVSSFSTPHDAADPVGYVFDDGEATLFLGTDLGHPTAVAADALKRSTAAVLEFNYDPQMLAGSARPPELKRRIAGNCGHLSNEDGAELLRMARPERLKCLLLGHLSRECNAPHLALWAAKAALADIGREGAVLAALEQDKADDLREF